METVFFSKIAINLLVKFINKFRLYRVEKKYKIAINREEQTVSVRVKLKRRKLPYSVTKIQLVGFGKAEILSCSLKQGKKVEHFDLSNILSKNKKELTLNHWVKHYGKKNDELIIKSFYTKRQTLVFFTQKNKPTIRKNFPNYIFLPKLK